eukprot:TRINITY_DN24917_c0_g3_i1.p1 TRINITY_DN24917_c0_g3~~TRINITY_DN24917_c0_g3_i1.p1  ORF type:complete len:1338 (-),score=269.45 TRINITY_DN24917_c0_g3_i1:88-4101(-)
MRGAKRCPEGSQRWPLPGASVLLVVILWTRFAYASCSCFLSRIDVLSSVLTSGRSLLPGQKRSRPGRQLTRRRAEAKRSNAETLVESMSRDEVTVEDRKLRAAIQSIERDQEVLRMQTPLLSVKTLLFVGSAGVVALLASLTAASSTWSIWLPSLSSTMFVYSAVSESNGIRFKAKARYTLGQSATLAAQQESALALAESRKVFLPFGVGLTAICAAACVTLRIFNEKIGDFIPENEETLLAGDNILLLAIAIVSVVGASVTTTTYLSTRCALTLSEEQLAKAETDWQAKRLPKVPREPSDEDTRNAVIATILVALLPLPFCVNFGELTNLFNLERAEFQRIADEITVVVSATSAALAALVFLLGEKDFTDAEQRVAVQAKQAALADMFFAQSQQEAAVMPVRSALSGAASSGAGFVVEVWRGLASLFPWPAWFGAAQSSLNAKLVQVEAAASSVEARMVNRGPSIQTRTFDAVQTSLLELKRVQLELFPPANGNSLMQEMEGLPPGQSKEFKGLTSEKRREVHLYAAELGFMSQSLTEKGARLVKVTNILGAATEKEEEDLVETLVEEFKTDVYKPLKTELDAALSAGVPDEWKIWVAPAAAAAASSQVTPLVLGNDVSNLVLPLVTGGIGLLTVYQERQGKEAVAFAKSDAASLQRRQAEAESLTGLAQLASAAQPKYLAVATVASEVACVGFFGPFESTALRLVCGPAGFVVCSFMLFMTVRRHDQVLNYISGAARIVDGKMPETRLRKGMHRAWLMLPGVMLLMPMSMPRRIAAVTALIAAEIAVFLADSTQQIAFGEFFAARTARVFSRTDAWAQIASSASRTLPLTSALALVNTLIATSLAAVNVPFGGLFPIFGVVVCLRAIQKGTEAEASAAITKEEGRRSQQFGSNPPPYQAQQGSEDLGPLERTTPRKRTSVVTVLKQLIQIVPNPFRMLGRAGRTLLRYFDESGPEDAFVDSVDVKVVKRVQADLEELRVTVRSNEKNWGRTGAFVLSLAAASLSAPFVLASLAEVVLPVAGTALTLFVVIAESDARSSVAQAKVHAAQLNEQSATMEELFTTSQLWKNMMLVMIGITDASALMALVLEKPFTLVAAYPMIRYFQAALQAGLVGVSVAVCSFASRRVLQVQQWATLVERISGDSFSVDTLASIDKREMNPADFLAGKAFIPVSKRRRRFLTAASVLPVVLCAIFPLGESLALRACASTAAGAFVAALLLLYAEIMSCKAERLQSGCQRASALSDAFSNRAEEQGALLPLNSAATIAIAGVITFATELSPFAAGALTILQVFSWVIASRKAVSTKFESAAGLQVRSKFTSEPDLSSFSKRFKSFMIK